MRKLPRIRLRTLMILVAISAVAIAAPGEYRNQRDCSALAREAGWFEKEADRNDKERSFCLSKSGHDSYEGEGRHDYLLDHDFFHGCLRFTFESWEKEAEWHEGESKEKRYLAKEYAGKSEEMRRRLLLPRLPAQLFKTAKTPAIW